MGSEDRGYDKRAFSEFLGEGNGVVWDGARGCAGLFSGGASGSGYVGGDLAAICGGSSKSAGYRAGVWWDVLDKPGQAGNYPEASACAMFVYTLARGVREGYLSSSFANVAKRGYSGIMNKFILRVARDWYAGASPDGKCKRVGR